MILEPISLGSLLVKSQAESDPINDFRTSGNPRHSNSTSQVSWLGIHFFSNGLLRHSSVGEGFWERPIQRHGCHSGLIPKLATETYSTSQTAATDASQANSGLLWTSLGSLSPDRHLQLRLDWIYFVSSTFFLLFSADLLAKWSNALANAVPSHHTGRGFGSDRSISMQQYETSCSQDAGQIYMTPWPEVAGSVRTGFGASWIASPPQPRFPAPRQLSQSRN